MTTTNSFEERIIEKIREVLLADSVILGYTQGRIYASHISSIDEPIYPAISIHLISSRAVFECPGMIEVVLQLDSWFPASMYRLGDIMTLHRKIRENIHRQNLIDSTIGISVGQSIESTAGPVMHEDDTDLFHYPVQYICVGA